jgi:hypothetical protein
MHTMDLPDGQSALRDKRVLVVEDEALVAMLLEDGLMKRAPKWSVPLLPLRRPCD